MKKLIVIMLSMSFLFSACLEDNLFMVEKLEEEISSWEEDPTCVLKEKEEEISYIYKDDKEAERCRVISHFAPDSKNLTEKQLMTLAEYDRRLYYDSTNIEYIAIYYSNYDEKEVVYKYHYRDGKILYKDEWKTLEEVKVDVWGD